MVHGAATLPFRACRWGQSVEYFPEQIGYLFVSTGRKSIVISAETESTA
jgi:hypothetical protein